MHLFEEGVLFQGCTFRVNTVRIKPVTVIEMLSFLLCMDVYELSSMSKGVGTICQTYRLRTRFKKTS